MTSHYMLLSSNKDTDWKNLSLRVSCLSNLGFYCITEDIAFDTSCSQRQRSCIRPLVKYQVLTSNVINLFTISFRKFVFRPYFLLHRIMVMYYILRKTIIKVKWKDSRRNVVVLLREKVVISALEKGSTWEVIWLDANYTMWEEVTTWERFVTN